MAKATPSILFFAKAPNHLPIDQLCGLRPALPGRGLEALADVGTGPEHPDEGGLLRVHVDLVTFLVTEIGIPIDELVEVDQQTIV